MSEISASAGESRTGKGSRRAKRHSTKVDFTPMVDLGFLLITFFILTSQLQEPKAMNLIMPANGPSMPVKTSTVLTIVPMENNRVFFYHGKFEEAVRDNSFGITTYDSQNGVGSLIRQKQQLLSQTKSFSASDVLLIIKPSSNSSLKNVIDALDEVSINGVHHYSFVDLDPVEQAFLKKRGFSH